MKQQEYIKEVDECWSFQGFLGNLREGIFNRMLFNELYNTLLKIRLDDYEVVERELVKLLWFIPIFMHRQKEYINFPSGEYDKLREDIEEQLARIFGHP